MAKQINSSIFKKKTTRSVKASASADMKKINRGIKVKKLIFFLITVGVLFIIIYIISAMRGTVVYVNGHQYIRVTPYSTVHDPDCPCGKGGQ